MRAVECARTLVAVACPTSDLLLVHTHMCAADAAGVNRCYGVEESEQLERKGAREARWSELCSRPSKRVRAHESPIEGRRTARDKAKMLTHCGCSELLAMDCECHLKLAQKSVAATSGRV